MEIDPSAAPEPVESKPEVFVREPKKQGSGFKGWLVALVLGLLVIGTGVNGALLAQDRSGIDQVDSQVSALSTQNAALLASLGQAQSDASGIQSSLASLQQTVSQGGSGTPVIVAGTDFTAAAKKIEPYTVYVEAGGRSGGGTGSGTIIRSNGYVLTNQHVISGATSIKVTLKTGESFSATLISSNADLDAAVLKLTTNRTDFPAAVIGSSASVIVGQEILSCGFPLGSDLFGNSPFGPATFNHGMVSAIRNLASGNTDNPNVRLDYIQIDADINPGNSGGGLFNLNGELIGIPAYGFATGVNAAIPIDAVKAMIQGAVGQ
jgi:serine protease Do